MSFSIDVAFIHAFDANIYELSQVDPQQILSWVDQRPGVKGKTYNVERINGIEAVPIANRHAQTQLTPFTHTRRRCTPSDYGVSEMLDDIDEVKLLINPTSAYAKGFAKAYNRKTAQTVIGAMLGNALAVDNQDAVTTVALPAGQQIANGGTNMTVAKLRTAGRIMDVNGIDPMGRHIAVSPYAIESLLKDTQITSSDFLTVNAIQAGTIKDGVMVMGFQFHKLTDALGAGAVMASPILPKVLNIRSCVAWQHDCVRAYIARGFTPEMPRDPGYWNNLRVMAKFVQAAVRVEDEGVVQIDIDESA